MNTKKTVIYARVSSDNQKNDLERQVEHAMHWTDESGFKNVETFTDIGSGLKYKRRNLNKILCVMQENRNQTNTF